MESNLSKARTLLREISGKKTLGVFTHRDGKVYHEGKEITLPEQARHAKQYEKVVTIKVKIYDKATMGAR